MQGPVESSFKGYVPHAFGRDLTQVSVRFGTETLRSHKCFKVTAALQLELQFLFIGLGLSGLPPFMRPWRCHYPIVSHLNLRFVNVQLHGSPALFSAVVHSQLLTAAHVQHLRVNVFFFVSNFPRADVNDFVFAAHRVSWKALLVSHCQLMVGSSCNRFRINNSSSFQLREFVSVRASMYLSLLTINA